MVFEGLLYLDLEFWDKLIKDTHSYNTQLCLCHTILTTAIILRQPIFFFSVYLIADFSKTVEMHAKYLQVLIDSNKSQRV